MSEQPAHDPGRFARAFQLAYTGKVEHLGGTQYRVAGNEQKYYDVDIAAEQPCYCADQDFEGRKIRNNCKHVLAAKILAKSPEVIQSLMELAYQRQQRAEELEAKRTRRKSA
jgi:hypothetical protein